MTIQQGLTDQAVLRELGTRLAAIRLERNLTQAQLADRAGISKRTLERLEQGASAQVASLIRVCRELDLLPRLDQLIPEPAPSPLALVKLRGRARRRASSKAAAPARDKKWTWGESP